jgi:hypothetical protein
MGVDDVIPAFRDEVRYLSGGTDIQLTHGIHFKGCEPGLPHPGGKGPTATASRLCNVPLPGETGHQVKRLLLASSPTSFGVYVKCSQRCGLV